MPKFFVFSDVHSYFTPLKDALTAAGWDSENPDHWLISCGDNFDRGKESREMWEFLMKTPRLICIRGNHEDLLDKCLARGVAAERDYANGTYRTIQAFNTTKAPFDVACFELDRMLGGLRRRMRNYFETQHYVFTHGWIPIPCLWEKGNPCPFIFDVDCHTECLCDKWRNAPASEWNAARWSNGMDWAHEGFILPDKTIVCGHWNASFGHMRHLWNWSVQPEDIEDLYQWGDIANHNPYKDVGIIAIDASTMVSNKVNVVVIDDDWFDEPIEEEIYR